MSILLQEAKAELGLDVWGQSQNREWTSFRFSQCSRC